MLPAWARKSVQVVRALQVSDHGTTQPDWSQATTTTVAGCSFQPSSGIDDIKNRSAVGGPAALYMPAGTDITGYDRVVLNGKTYEVVGEPEAWEGPTPRLNHLRVMLHVWEG